MTTVAEKIVYLKPTEVTVRDGLARYRKDMAGIKDLAQSIKDNGQLQPIRITADKELMAGGRRLAACLFAGVNVAAIVEETEVSDDRLRVVEILENVERKAFTPAEEELAIAELHRIKLKDAGEDGEHKGSVKKDWTLEDTAKLLGVSRASVSNSLHHAELVEKYPELKQAKTKGEIRNKGQKAERIAQAAQTVKQAEAVFKTLPKTATKKYNFDICCHDAEQYIKKLEGGVVDIIITDPPYAIDAHTNRHTTFNMETDTYEDTKEKNDYLFRRFPSEAARVLKDDGCLYMFIGTEHFLHFKEAFEAAGMNVYNKEIIWIKGVSGQSHRPDLWPGDAYEKILFARKRKHYLVKEGLPNWVQCDRIPSGKQRRHAEKPVPLFTNLLTRSAMPRQILLDPFMGTAPVIEAAVQYNMTAWGCDIAEAAVTLAKERMLNYND